MKTINRLLVMVVALTGLQSMVNAAAAANPVNDFKTAVLAYESALLKGKALDPVAHYNLLSRIRKVYVETPGDARAAEMEKFAASKGLHIQGLGRRLAALQPLVAKIERDHEADAQAAGLQALQAGIDQIEADKILNESAASSMPGSPRGSVLNDSAAPSEAGDISAHAAPNRGAAHDEAHDVLNDSAAASDDDEVASLSAGVGRQPAAPNAGASAAAVPEEARMKQALDKLSQRRSASSGAGAVDSKHGAEAATTNNELAESRAQTARRQAVALSRQQSASGGSAGSGGAAAAVDNRIILTDQQMRDGLGAKYPEINSSGPTSVIVGGIKYSLDNGTWYGTRPE